MDIKELLVNHFCGGLHSKIRQMAEERAILNAELHAVLSQNAALTNQAQTLAADQASLRARVVELSDQVRTLARRDGVVGTAYATPETANPPPETASRRAAKFVVFSNPRSGSTWLETMLGLLPDVYIDYELKWGVTYTPSDIHAVRHEHSKTISQLLEDMDTDASVTGSKFVFDVHGLTPLDFRKLTSQVGPEIRIVHLMRNYRDVFLSIRRGFYHAPARTEKLSKRLSGALDSADIRHAQPQSPHNIPPLVCFNELTAMLDSDIRIHSLLAAGFPYLQVQYDEVGDKLADIVRFTGSQASPEIVADVLARPAVVKLPPFQGASLVANLPELEPLFDNFEALRQHLVAKSVS